MDNLNFQSEIRNMSIESENINAINLAQGICDMDIPSVLETELKNAVGLGFNHYTRCDGLDILKEQLAFKANKFNHIEAKQNSIIVSAGATGALYCAMSALLRPGDEVILFEPFYGYHDHTVKSLNLIPVYYRLDPVDWSIDFNQLDSLITSKVRAILFSTPMNPCGKIFTEDELRSLGDICKRHKLTLFSDEIYEYITFEGHRHISPASIDILKNRTITISGYSKTFSITGWRIGYSISNPDQAEQIGTVNDLIYVCAPSMAQYAVAKAIQSLPDIFYTDLAKKYLHKRDQLCGVLSDLGLNPHVPDGAYYILADVSRIPGSMGKEKAMWLLDKSHIGVVPGTAFYDKGFGDDIARICFARSDEIIQSACEELYAIKHLLL